MSYRVSPSSIASHFYYDCQRLLRYSMVSSAERRLVGIPEAEFDHSPIMRSVLEAGHVWEESVIQTLGNAAHVKPGNAPLRDRHFTVEETLDLLRRIQPGEFIYQATLVPPDSFYQQYGIDPNLVEFAANRPDLIECLAGQNGERLFRVIDVKRGESLALAYKIQICLYTLQLQVVLNQQNINATVDTVGGVWLGSTSAYQAFSLEMIYPHVEQFLQSDLMAIAQQSISDTFWHLNFRCERCGWFEHCRTEAHQDNDLSRLTKLTAPGKQYLNSLGVRTVQDLGQFLQRPDASQLLNQCASLKGEKHFLQNKVVALTSNQPVGHGTASPALPIREDVAITITIQKEPLGRSFYLVGVLVEPSTKKAKDIWETLIDPLADKFFRNGKATPFVWIANQPSEIDRIRREFIQTLICLFEIVDHYNTSKTLFQEKLSLQCYVNTDLEKKMLQDWLLEAVPDVTVGEDAMRLSLWLQAPELLDLERHPEEQLPFSVVSLLRVLALLFAMPIDTAYTLWHSLPALGSAFQYTYQPFFHYRLAQTIQPQAIHAAWYLGDHATLDRLQKKVQQHLYALRALREQIRRRVEEGALFAWAPTFQMPRIAKISTPNLSRLAFFVRFEQMLQTVEIREGRTEPREVQLEQGLALLLEATDPHIYNVLAPANMQLESNQFGTFLLARDNNEGRREQLSYNDRKYAESFGAPRKANLARVQVMTVLPNDDGQPQQIFLKEPPRFDSTQVQRGDRFLLLKCQTDFNTKKVIRCLQRLDEFGAGLFGELLEDPIAACQPLPLPLDINQVLQGIEGQLNLSPSQLDAFRAVCCQRVVAVWGPPGTGKTHFLGKSLLALSYAYSVVGRPLRILVTGQSHYAIENVLRKVVQLQSEMPAIQLTVAKVGDWKLPPPADATIFSDASLEYELNKHDTVIVGATMYATWKAIDEGGLQPFDLVVIDEASQVRVAESSIPISLVSSTGRLLLTGDDYQLPPIVQGVYPAPQPGQPALHRSIFELITTSIGALDPIQRVVAIENVPHVCMLLENRRMNEVLNSLVSRLLYGDRYRPASAQIANQRLQYQPSNNCSELVRLCLDPDYPLVVVLADAPLATNENRLEAEIVKDLVMELWQGLETPAGQPYQDQEFFEHAVFIVSPHRAQNSLIKRRLLAEKDDWEPRSDTVDKMQGQEADAVIVSYGVSDPEYAAQEAEFIYSRNRLNVAITRAKSKCVIILSRQLLEAPPSVWDNPQVAEGLGFMRGVVQTVRQHGATDHLQFNGVNLTLYRLEETI